MEHMNAYPTEWACDVVLSDGATVHVRPIRPEDRPQLEALYNGASRRSRYMRFFSAPRRLPEALLDRLANVDYIDRMALVAEHGDKIIGVGSYDRLADKPTAEVAFMVDDDNQGRGLGTLLLEHLATIAGRHGIERFMALTLPENDEMLGVFKSVGFKVTRAPFADSRPAVELSFPIATTSESVLAREERDRHAVVRSIEPILAPKSVAVIGASTRANSIGRRLVENLVASGFRGTIYPVNPHAGEIAGLQCIADLTHIDGPVDLAVIAVPANLVEDVVAQCGEAGVRGLVIISGGFAEVGAEGRDRQAGVVDLAHRHGMRIVGPNCMGVFNTDPEVRLDATFALHELNGIKTSAGRVALMSQSGGIGIVALDEAQRRGLGLSSFVSVGNKADISGNDLLQYWESDPQTAVIMLYLESFGNPRNFARIARRVSGSKPILAVKGGRSAAGARASASHTAALAGSDVAVDELFRQSGVTRADTLEELFDAAEGFAKAPLPRGRSVAVVGNAGGPGILAADACENNRLVLATLSAATKDALRSFLPSAAAVENPVDMIATATASDYGRALAVLLADDAVDAVIVTHVAAGAGGLEEVIIEIDLAQINRTAERAKPIVLASLGPELTAERRRAIDVALYRFPEAAAKVIGHLADRQQWLEKPRSTAPRHEGFDLVAAHKLVEAVLADRPDGGWLDPADAVALLSAAGVKCAPVRKARDADEAIALANEMGYPVALKAAALALVHKTDRGGVHVGLSSEFDVTCAYLDMQRHLGDEMGGAIVQPMAASGVEMLVGVTNDRHFGPLLLVGAGGVGAELYADRAARIVPLTESDASEMVESLRIAKLLNGFRGSAPVDVTALREVIERVAELAEAIPEIADIDLNPLIVSARGATAVDIKVRVTPAPFHLEDEMRRLRG